MIIYDLKLILPKKSFLTIENSFGGSMIFTVLAVLGQLKRQ